MVQETIYAAKQPQTSAAIRNAFAIPANSHARVWCTKRITINATPQKVWEVLTAIGRWAEWQHDISNCTIASAPAPGATFSWKTDGANIKSTLHTVLPNTHFGWTGRTFGATAIHNWVLVANGQLTEVVVEESMDGVLARLFSKAFNKNLEAGMGSWLQLLKQQAEM